MAARKNANKKTAAHRRKSDRLDITAATQKRIASAIMSSGPTNKPLRSAYAVSACMLRLIQPQIRNANQLYL